MMDCGTGIGTGRRILPTMPSGETYVRKLFSKPIATAAGRITNPSPVQERAPTGWNRVDRCLSRARARFDAASVEEDWQAVGLLCREVLISLAQAVYDPAIHTPEDGKTPSSDGRQSDDRGLRRPRLPGSLVSRGPRPCSGFPRPCAKPPAPPDRDKATRSALPRGYVFRRRGDLDHRQRVNPGDKMASGIGQVV